MNNSIAIERPSAKSIAANVDYSTIQFELPFEESREILAEMPYRYTVRGFVDRFGKDSYHPTGYDKILFVNLLYSYNGGGEWKNLVWHNWIPIWGALEQADLEVGDFVEMQVQTEVYFGTFTNGKPNYYLAQPSHVKILTKFVNYRQSIINFKI